MGVERINSDVRFVIQIVVTIGLGAGAAWVAVDRSVATMAEKINGLSVLTATNQAHAAQNLVAHERNGHKELDDRIDAVEDLARDLRTQIQWMVKAQELGAAKQGVKLPPAPLFPIVEAEG